MKKITLNECVRSNLMIPAADVNGILTIKTDGFAKDICYSDEFKFLVQQVENGLCSPLVDITPFLKGIYKSCEEGNEKYARMSDHYPISAYLNHIAKLDSIQSIQILLMNEAKLTDEERSRLYCRRFGYVDTNIFKRMAMKNEFNGLPKLIPLNEDNMIADLSKFKRSSFNRNDPANTMDGCAAILESNGRWIWWAEFTRRKLTGRRCWWIYTCRRFNG